MDYSFLIFFSPPKVSQHKAGISKQQQTSACIFKCTIRPVIVSSLALPFVCIRKGINVSEKLAGLQGKLTSSTLLAAEWNQ